MSHSEIDAVRELLRSKPRPAGFAERRERLDAIGSTYPPDADVSLEATDANGVAANGRWRRAAILRECSCFFTAAALARARS